MVIKRIGAVSFAKVCGLIYTIMGFFFGACVSLVALVAGGFPNNAGAPMPAAARMMLSAGAIVFFPILYGLMGFLFSLIGAAIYNVAARMVGGIEIEVDRAIV